MNAEERLILKRLMKIFGAKVHDDIHLKKMSPRKRLREKMNL